MTSLMTSRYLIINNNAYDNKEQTLYDNEKYVSHILSDDITIKINFEVKYPFSLICAAKGEIHKNAPFNGFDTFSCTFSR